MRIFSTRRQQILQRRWAGISRLMRWTWFRDRFSATPSVLYTFLGERTLYIKDASVADNFEVPDSADLGIHWSDWALGGYDGLAIVSHQVVPGGIGVSTERFEVYDTLITRDSWARLEVRALTGSSRASVGLVLRSDPTGNAYLATAEIAAGVSSTRLFRINGGTVSLLATDPTPWIVGQQMRFEADWNILRVYQNSTLVLEHTDSSPLLVDGFAGVEAVRVTGGDLAALDGFIAGPLRMEYVGALLQMGDLQYRLGDTDTGARPARIDFDVTNRVAIGGQPRVAALIRHGINIGPGTYDHPLAEVSVFVDMQETEPPIATGVLLVDQIDAITEDRVKVTCQGRDAFLDLFLEAGLPSQVSPLPTCQSMEVNTGGNTTTASHQCIQDIQSLTRTIGWRHTASTGDLVWSDDPYITLVVETIDSGLAFPGPAALYVDPTSLTLYLLRSKWPTGVQGEMWAYRAAWTGTTWNFAGSADTHLDTITGQDFRAVGIHKLLDGRVMALWIKQVTSFDQQQVWYAFSGNDGVSWDPPIMLTLGAFGTSTAESVIMANGAVVVVGGSRFTEMWARVYNPPADTWSTYQVLGQGYNTGGPSQASRICWDIVAKPGSDRVLFVWYPQTYFPTVRLVASEYQVIGSAALSLIQQDILPNMTSFITLPAAGWFPTSRRWAVAACRFLVSPLLTYWARPEAAGLPWVQKAITSRHVEAGPFIPESMYCDTFLTQYIGQGPALSKFIRDEIPLP